MTEGRNKPEQRSRFFLFSVICLLSSAALVLPGCGPKYTYPADQVPQSVERLCLNEHKLEVVGRVVGKTIGALYYVDDILDANGQIPKEIHERMGQIMQAVTRVGLSTDLPVDYCVVVIRDRSHKNELVITRSLDDTKRANSDAIGVEESINRTLFGQGKYQLAQEDEKNFVLREVKTEDFLAEQIAQRVRFGIAKEEKPEDNEAAGQQAFVLVDGAYNRTDGGNRFRFSILSLKAEEPHQTLLLVFRTVSDVLRDYKFEDYVAVEILDYLNRQKLDVPREAVVEFQQKKLPEQTIIDRYLSESQSLQEAFKLFGFNLSESVTDTEAAPPIAPATP